MIRAATVLVLLALSGILVGYGPSLTEPRPPVVAAPSAVETPAPAPSGQPGRSRAVAQPLAGVRVALDPGHQLGNHNFPRKINQQVPAGGFTKPCNSTGTATNGGYAEATLNFAVATLVKKRLEALGATVVMTRTKNSQKLWGPCVNKRGRFGELQGADLTVSLHGDGARASGRGFHVIAPTARKPWTHDIASDSLRLAKALRAGLDARKVPRSNYLASGTGLNVRSDLGTLNMSDVPIAMVELGNMRNAADARRMTTPHGRAVYAAALVLGIRHYLSR